MTWKYSGEAKVLCPNLPQKQQKEGGSTGNTETIILQSQNPSNVGCNKTHNHNETH